MMSEDNDDQIPFTNFIEFQLLLQILFAASWEFESIVSQQFTQQNFPSTAQYQLHQHHTHSSSHPQEHHDYRQSSQPLNHDFQPSTTLFDFDKFNQQAKHLQAQLNFFNQQQQRHIQQQINSVHQPSSEPQFDFAVNGNYTDLEKASEQFVNLGNLVGKQNIAPKVIKITKTVAVKQPVPVPYPVIVKEQVPYDFSNHGHHSHQHVPTTTARPLEFKSPTFFSYSNYTNKYPTQNSASLEPYRHQQQASETYRHHQTSESYRQQHVAQTSAEYDTEPFYVTTPQKETIKIVPVPYYIDDEGNKIEISPQTSNSHDTDSDAFYPSRQTTSSSDGPGKFQSYSFSYHPPPQNKHSSPPTVSQTRPEFSTNSQQQFSSQQSHDVPDTKYYYDHDSEFDKSASSPHCSSEESSEAQHHHENYQYKYVSYE